MGTQTTTLRLTQHACENLCTPDLNCVAYEYTRLDARLQTSTCEIHTEAITHSSGTGNGECHIKPTPAPTMPPTMPPSPAPTHLRCQEINKLDILFRETICNDNPVCTYLKRKEKCAKRTKCKALDQQKCALRFDCHQIYKKGFYKRCCSLDYGSDYNSADNNYCDPNLLLQCKNLGEVDCRNRLDCTPLYVPNTSTFNKCCNPLRGSLC